MDKLTSFRKRIRIWWLKRQARGHYLAVTQAFDDNDGGYKIIAYTLSRDMEQHRIEFNRIMDELTELDETTPGYRL